MTTSWRLARRLVVALVLTAIGGASTASAQVTPLSPPVTVKVAALEITADAGIYIGLARGYFKEEGLTLELERVDRTPTAQLAAGQLDVGVGSISAGLFNAVARGLQVRVVAEKGSAFDGRSAAAFVVRKDLVDSGRYKTPKDLKGMKVAIAFKGFGPHIEINKLLESAGLKEEDIDLVDMAFPQMPVALGSKAIDAALSIEPFTTRALEGGLVANRVLLHEIYPKHTAGVVLYGPEFIAKKPEAAKRFMVGYLRGVRDFNDAFIRNTNRAEIVRILTQYTTVKDPRLYEKMVPAGLNSNGEIHLEGVAFDQQWYHQRGLVPKPVDLKEVIDTQYLRYAHERLGRWPRD